MGYVDDVQLGASASISNAATQSAGTVFNFKSKGAKGSSYASETGSNASASASADKTEGGGFSTGQVILVVAVLGVAVVGAVILSKRK